MQKHVNHSRRAALVATLGVTAALGALTSGCSGAADGDRRLAFQSLAEAQQEIARLGQSSAVRSNAVWNWPQTLEHCAQSIEFSMLGYPESRSELFQRTVGAAAIRWFAWQGRMTHDLAEPIPGAPGLPPTLSTEEALARLTRVIDAFRGWSQPLAPHFAYGALSKAEYERAHAMHIANHVSQFSTVT